MIVTYKKPASITLEVADVYALQACLALDKVQPSDRYMAVSGKIQGIKYIRARFNLFLPEAKAIWEAFEAQNR